MRGARPSEVVREVYRRIDKQGKRPVWIELVPESAALARAEELEASADARALPLYGVPFAVKDNIDVAGMPTTAGCPAFAYTPAKSATVVERLLAAGAILIGKTNLDQFATGLVGVRSPYGACSSVFDASHISGGSSAGSAVAVASGLVSFSLGTDTAGSGRVPAAFNNIVGWKPTRGAVSAAGVVPACRTLDCVSVFTLTSSDALQVMKAASGYDALDPFSRVGQEPSPWLGGPFRFGVPSKGQLEFFGDDAAAELFARAEERLAELGGTRVEIDFALFRAVAELLYSGPWVAERLAAIREFFELHEAEMDPTVRAILGGSTGYSAVDAYRAIYRLAELRQKSEAEWRRMDVMLLPTTGTTYKIEEVRAEPIKLNANLGFYTNFVNLLDLAAVAVPAGFRSNGLPFGVSLIGRAWTDSALLTLGDRLHRAGSSELGGTKKALQETPAMTAGTPPGCVLVAVLGAHLTGQPLNWQLRERGARLVRTCRTARGYRFYALSGTSPAKPGLVRDQLMDGPGIEVEVWAVPEARFGGFVAAIPPPLSIGSAELEDGEVVKCFLCEPYAIGSAEEITELGGWRAYLARESKDVG
ncbi:MAG: Amidase [Bryobacterales bacterium]|nr:Amidase [Bryobacterales bacterium]